METCSATSRRSTSVNNKNGTVLGQLLATRCGKTGLIRSSIVPGLVDADKGGGLAPEERREREDHEFMCIPRGKTIALSRVGAMGRIEAVGGCRWPD